MEVNQTHTSVSETRTKTVITWSSSFKVMFINMLLTYFPFIKCFPWISPFFFTAQANVDVGIMFVFSSRESELRKASPVFRVQFPDWDFSGPYI